MPQAPIVAIAASVQLSLPTAWWANSETTLVRKSARREWDRGLLTATSQDRSAGCVAVQPADLSGFAARGVASLQCSTQLSDCAGRWCRRNFFGSGLSKAAVMLRTLYALFLRAARAGLELLCCLAIAAFGAAAAYGLVGLAFRRELARIRERQPAAMLCSYDYDQLAIGVVPLGAIVALLLSALVHAAWCRWRRAVDGPADGGRD